MARVLKSSFIMFLISAFTFIGMTQSAHAVMISTGEASATLPNARAHINAVLERPDVQSQLEKLGISKADAQSRVAALNDEDIMSLNNKIDNLPAGADGGASIIGALVLIFVILLITDLLGLTKVFPFTHPISGR